MTHADRRDRRKSIAAFVRDHGSTWDAVASAATEFGVSQRTAEDACHEWKVKLRRTPHAATDVVLKIVADLVNTTDTLTDIAERHRVTPQYVSNLYLRCRKAGLGPWVAVRPVGGRRA